jgi:hypothetical protein
MPIWALIEVLSTMEACFEKIGSSAWIRKYGPFTLIAIDLSKAASLHCSSGPNSATPALTKRMSRWPKASLIALGDCLLARRIAGIGLDHQCLVAKLGAGCLDALGAAAGDRDRAPSAMNWRAVSRPMPLVPPVIRAVLFCRRDIVSVSI